MAATLPTLPTAYSLAAYSLPTGTERYCYGDSGADATYTVTLQSALNDCVNGDVLILKAGETYTGNFVAPVKGSGDPIYIISSAMASMPAEGTRVSPSDAANMPKVTSGTALTGPLWFANDATSAGGTWRVCGVELTSDYEGVASGCNEISRVGYRTSIDLVNDDTVDEVIFDRCWIHGNDGDNLANSIITYRVDQVAIVDCYINEIHSTISESKGVWLYSGGTGPFLIRNNYISACSQFFFICDSPNNQPDVNPEPLASNVTFEQNLCEKLSKWHSDRPDYAGINYGCKYGIEFKGASLVLMQGNIIRDLWADSDSGAPIVLTAKGNHITDVTVRRNYIANAGAGITVQSASIAGSTAECHRVLLEDNVFNKLNRAGQWLCGVSASAVGRTTDVTIQHNTFLSTDYNSPGTLYLSGTVDAIYDLEFYDNIILDTGSTVAVAGDGTHGRTAATKFCTTFDFDTNVAISDQTSYWGADTNWTNWSQEAAVADVGFTDTTFDDLADYALLGSSDYYEAGTDSEDIGADIDAITAALSGDDYGTNTYYLFTAGGLTFGVQT